VVHVDDRDRDSLALDLMEPGGTAHRPMGHAALGRTHFPKDRLPRAQARRSFRDCTGQPSAGLLPKRQVCLSRPRRGGLTHGAPWGPPPSIGPFGITRMIWASQPVPISRTLQPSQWYTIAMRVRH
jgi:hypothetical protein